MTLTDRTPWHTLDTDRGVDNNKILSNSDVGDIVILVTLWGWYFQDVGSRIISILVAFFRDKHRFSQIMNPSVCGSRLKNAESDLEDNVINGSDKNSVEQASHMHRPLLIRLLINDPDIPSQIRNWWDNHHEITTVCHRHGKSTRFLVQKRVPLQVFEGIVIVMEKVIPAGPKGYFITCNMSVYGKRRNITRE